MAYINTMTGKYPVTEQEIRQQYPNTSFSVPFVPPEEFVYVFPSPTPIYDELSQVVQEAQPVVTNKGWYEQTWSVIDLDPTVVAIKQKEKARQAILSEIQQLESFVTQRRLREAVLGLDNGWLSNQNTQIDNLRIQLQALQ